MVMYPTNTPLDKWLTSWLVLEVEDILDGGPQRLPKYKYSGMTLEQRKRHKLPASREECIEFIREHRPNAGLQEHD